jgi:pSer/pThr/pTyr-binding forkhead associated (FHA) protein
MAEQLLVISGAEMGRVFSLRPNHSLAVGRGQESETRINDPRMSRVHFRINWGANGVELSDNNSTGGLLLVTSVLLRWSCVQGMLFPPVTQNSSTSK